MNRWRLCGLKQPPSYLLTILWVGNLGRTHHGTLVSASAEASPILESGSDIWIGAMRLKPLFLFSTELLTLPHGPLSTDAWASSQLIAWVPSSIFSSRKRWEPHIPKGEPSKWHNNSTTFCWSKQATEPDRGGTDFISCSRTGKVTSQRRSWHGRYHVGGCGNTACHTLLHLFISVCKA